MKTISVLAVAAVLFACTGMTWAQDDEDLSPVRLAQIADALAPSLVRVEYTIRYDRGELPPASHRGDWQTAAGGGGWAGWDNWEQLVKEERPAERAGFLVGPDLVYTSDPMVHPRFIQSIQVRLGAGAQVVEATPTLYPRDESGWLLKLAGPIPGAKPLEFDATIDGPYFGVTHGRWEGIWMTRITGLRGGAYVTEDGQRVSQASPTTLVVGKNGKPVGISGMGILPVDDSWKGSPEIWAALSQQEMQDLLDRTARIAADCILRVEVNFRSPRSQGESAGPWGMRHYGPRDEDDTATEWTGLGVLADDQTLIVLANLRPKTTARLERVRAFLPDGRVLTARFDGSLRDWGCFLATLEEPLDGAPAPAPARFSSASLTEQRYRLLLKGEIGVRGETRIAHFWRERILGFTLGHQGRLYPSLSGAGAADHQYNWMPGGGLAGSNFLFDATTPYGSLVTIPIERRERIADENRRWRQTAVLAVPVALVQELLSDRNSHMDPENCPLSEEEEDRLAWLGIEMQSMNPELARVNNVVEQTRNGQSGAIVTFIYANSPAAEAGLEMGDILLRMHVEGHPRPLEVSLGDSGYGGMFDEFWTMFDQIPVEYMDQMPSPWGSAENTLTRALTDIGFGTPFVAEVFRNGEVMQIPFEVVAGPAHYEAARRFKSEEAGLTVRDLTYEVRRYFQIGDDEPGIIISRVENGGRASVAGLRPFELILAVNDQPVHNVAEFEKAIAAGGEYRMSIKRMTTGRIAKMRIDAAQER